MRTLSALTLIVLMASGQQAGAKPDSLPLDKGQTRQLQSIQSGAVRLKRKAAKRSLAAQEPAPPWTRSVQAYECGMSAARKAARTKANRVKASCEAQKGTASIRYWDGRCTPGDPNDLFCRVGYCLSGAEIRCQTAAP